MPIRVLVADDHAIVRRGIVFILTEDPGILVVGEAADGPELLAVCREIPADIVILDLNMPGPSGLTILAQLKAEHPQMAVLVLSIHDEEQYGTRVIRSGASGYLAKNAAPDNLVEAVRRLAAGHRYISADLAEAMMKQLETNDQDRHAALSDREFEVFHGLAAGQTVSEIAERLSLSVKTVSTYRSRVLEKLGVRTNADLARYAVAKGLIESS